MSEIPQQSANPDANASLEWLRRRWKLPGEAVPAVLALLHAESAGSTSRNLASPIADWGEAAAPPSAGKETPMVLVEAENGMHLQSLLLFHAETRIARRVMTMARRKPLQIPELSAQVARLFPDAEEDNPQVAAVRLAATRAIAMITGGPGTGKTHTLARLLALLLSNGIDADKLHLTAPTGKAAERMKEAVQEAVTNLPQELHPWTASLQKVANQVSTLHAWLQYHPRTRRCRRVGIPAGTVLVVDECSMVDVHVWNSLFTVLPEDARMVLVGDPHQLESVGQGATFAALVRGAANLPELRAAHVHLTETRRFRDRPDILALARALENSDPVAVETILQRCREGVGKGGVNWIPAIGPVLALRNYPESVLQACRRVATADTPERALQELQKICILTAFRDERMGALRVSQDLDRHLQEGGGSRNQPILITRNDPETGLRNGSIGILHREPSGSAKAYFSTGDGKPLHAYPIARLPDFQIAWAITIHRSQGSEFNQVMILPPRGESPLATRELLYTAITRAREEIHVAGDLASIKAATIAVSPRQSLLGHYLRQDLR